MAKRGRIRKLFPGGNTAYGFHSFYDHIVRPGANRIFVIKGGPGVGKSTFMRAIADKLVNRGHDVELHHCSSDNGSIDGVYIPALDVALIDGTAPHIVDPKNPGAVDEIVHLGDHWDLEGLRGNKGEILATNREVARSFNRAYDYLAAARGFNDCLESYMMDTGALDINKANAATERLFARVFGASRGNGPVRVRRLFASGITPEGPRNYLETLVGHLSKRFILKGQPGTGRSTMVRRIAERAEIKGFSIEAFHCSLDPERLDHLIIPDLSIAIVNGSDPHAYSPKEGDTVIETRDWVDNAKLAPFADEMATARELYKKAFDQAVSFVARAKAVHDEMETHYIPNMDFDAINARRDKVLDEILALAKDAEPAAE